MAHPADDGSTLSSLPQGDAYDTFSSTTPEHVEKDILVAIQYDGTKLTLEQRRFLRECGYRPEDVVPNYDASDYVNSPLFGAPTKLSREDMLVEEAMACGAQLDYDVSALTPEQRQAVFDKYFAIHLEMHGLKSPRHYDGISQCLSVSETAWPGTVAMLKAEKLKRGYIEPEDLIERLRKLKPSDNFELRKFRHPHMEWRSPSPLSEDGFEVAPSWPHWLYDQFIALGALERRLERTSVPGCYKRMTPSAAFYRQEMKDRWAAFQSGIEMTPIPDLHLLRDIGRSPGGTLFPWYLVKGLMTLRTNANDVAAKIFDAEDRDVMDRRRAAIHQWRERVPNLILSDDVRYLHKTWPVDLMAELEDFDRQAIRHGRDKYVSILEEIEPKMQALVTFWRDCGLITGQRTTPSCWWQDPKRKAAKLDKPQYLQDRLVAIGREFGYQSEMGRKLRMIETSRWVESIISGHSELTAPNGSLAQSLLEELDIVWRKGDIYDWDDTEDEMIAKIRDWRTLSHQHPIGERLRTSDELGLDAEVAQPIQIVGSPLCSGDIVALQVDAAGLVMAPEQLWQLQATRSGAAPHHPRISTTAENPTVVWQGRLRSRTKVEVQTTWHGRLRNRSKTVNSLCEKTGMDNIRSAKPRGIVKRKRVSRKQVVAMEERATPTTARKVDLAYPVAQSHLKTSAPRGVPAGVAEFRGTYTRSRPLRQASMARPQGIQKIRNSRRRQTQSLTEDVVMTKGDQGSLPMFTPPSSE